MIVLRLCELNSFICINALSKITGHPVDILTHVITGGRNELRGTWVHPRLAVNIAQWISPLFDVQVSGWVYEIAVTGKVTVGQEKTYQQLLELQNENKQLKNENWKLKQKKQYHKFKKGPSFYIISDIS